jgi:hypothetical protein
MARKAIRSSWRATCVIWLAVVTTPSLGLAVICGLQTPGVDCALQEQTPISFTGWQTQGWAWYCGGDHPILYSWLFRLGVWLVFMRLSRLPP